MKRHARNKQEGDLTPIYSDDSMPMMSSPHIDEYGMASVSQREHSRERMLVKRIRFKTHPLDHVILREIYDSETESDSETKDTTNSMKEGNTKDNTKGDAEGDVKVKVKVKCKKLVAWTMQGKSGKNGRKGPGRPTKYEIKSEDDSSGSASRRKRGRPKGSRNSRNGVSSRNRSKVKSLKKRKRSNSGHREKKKRKKSREKKTEHIPKREQNTQSTQSTQSTDYSEEWSDFSESELLIGNIYDDIDSDRASDGEVSVVANEEAILLGELKRSQMLEERQRMKRRKRKREEAMNDDLDEHQRRIKREKTEKGRARSVTVQAKSEQNVNSDITGNLNAGSMRPNAVHSLTKSRSTSHGVDGHPGRGRNVGNALNAVPTVSRSNSGSTISSTNQLLTTPMPHFNVHQIPDFSNIPLPTTMVNGQNVVNPGVNPLGTLPQELALPSISNLFTPNAPIPFPQIPTTNLPVPATPPNHPTSHQTSDAVMGLLSQISSGSSPMNPPITNQDMMDSLQWLSGSSSQRAPSDNGLNGHFLSNPLSQHSIDSLSYLDQGANASFASFNSLLGEDTLQHPVNGTGPLLNNYGSIINNNYLLKKLNTPQGKRRRGSNGGTSDANSHKNAASTQDGDAEGRESPLIPPLVDQCAGPGCNNTKSVDGGKLKMCGKCYSVKYCGRQCQMKDLEEHRRICRRPEETPVAQKRVTS